MTEAGVEAPTLRVHPGDRVVLRLKNEAGEAPGDFPAKNACEGMVMTPGSTNLHFHGLSIPPVCHQDDVLRTQVSAGAAAFEYRFQIPASQTPGLYWYHPHPHGFSEGQVLGGASGAMIVEGIENYRSEVTGLAERVVVLRDQLQPGQQLNYMEPGEESEKDVSVNFVPVSGPLSIPSVLSVKGGEREFWRVLNASADTYFDLAIVSGAPRELELVALDGAPLRRVISRTNIPIPPGGRAEFIVRMPGAGKPAQLVSRRYHTGPDGTNNPARVLAKIVSRHRSSVALSRMPQPIGAAMRVADLRSLQPARIRKLYLSEDRADLTDPTSLAQYFITEEGATPRAFDMMRQPPEITVQQGTVEDWIIENRAREAHTFHIHQLHFQVLGGDFEMRDTIDIPFWDGKNAEYPAVRLRMDFRPDGIAGTFVYHCHILEHEDAGMMGRIKVEPAVTDVR